MKKKNEFKSSKDILQSVLSGIKPTKNQNVVEWILDNKFRTEDGIPVSFDERRYLIDMLNDMTPTQAIMSGSQLGKTVNYYFKALYFCFNGKNVLFSEPTQDLRDALTKTKLNRLIEQNELLKENTSGDLNMKRVKDRILHLTYTFGTAPVGISSDVNFYDETSLSNRSTIDQWTGRLMNSKFQYEYFVSNPQQPHDLLHNKFLDSNQNHWAIQCSHCSKRQILNYDGLYGYNGNFNKEKGVIECQYCQGGITPDDIKMGEWVKRFTNRTDVSGYWLWQGMRVFDNLEAQNRFVRKMVSEEEKSKAAFYSMFLGLPYGGSDITISKELFLPHISEPINPKNMVYAGFDQGNATGHHWVVGKGETIFAMGVAKTWGEIREVMKKYAVQYAVVDQNPEHSNAKEFQAEYPNMVWRCNYVTNKAKEMISYDEEKGLVHVARHVFFDQIIKDIGEGKMKFAFRKDDPTFDDFMLQFSTLSKLAELDGVGNPTFKWDAPKGAWDHFAHAYLYSQVARHRLEQMMPRFGIFDSENNDTTKGGGETRNIHIPTEEETSWLDL